MTISATCLLFPGQGAQKVGMGQDLAAAFPAAREVFETARHETGIELDKLCFEGPIEELSRSNVAQPAILTVSVALLRSMAEATDRPPNAVAAAGLSLGEYTALVAAGALEFADAVRLVQGRGLYMQQACDANPGTMYSIIGLEDAQVEEACEAARNRTGGGVWPANYNSPGQLVISGEVEAAEAAADICSGLGARKTVRLKVAGAFHTQLMQPAAEKLAGDLSAVQIGTLAYPVVANVTGQPVESPEEVRRLLAQQVTHPVRWRDCMGWVIGQGVRQFYEVGPGHVLRGLLKRIDPSCTCAAVNNEADVRAYAETSGPVPRHERKEP